MIRFTQVPPAAALTAAALALGACGSDAGNDAGRASNASSDGPLAYARCMREHGVDMPDPERAADGKLLFRGPEPGAGVGPDVLQRAEEACKEKLEAGVQVAPEDRRDAQERGLKLARCMRERGIDMPDPDAEGRLQLRMGEGPDPSDPAFREAEQACEQEVGRR